MRLFASLSKVEEQDDGTIKVFGVASSGSRDEAGEIITPDAMKAAIPDYMAFGAVREMHQPKAAGTALECTVDADGITQFGAHVVDPVAVQKVKANVYKGFSIGGKVLARDPQDRTTITKIRLSEISLVDRPCNNDATLNLWKADIAGPEGTDMSETPTISNDAVKARAADLAKAAGKPDRANDFLVKAREELVAEASTENGVTAVSEVTEAAGDDAAKAAAAGEALSGAEPALTDTDPAAALEQALERAAKAAAPAQEAEVASAATPGLADFAKGLESLSAGDEPLVKGLWAISYLSEAVQSLITVQEIAASETANKTADAPQMLADAAQKAGQALMQYVKETLADAMARMQSNGAALEVVVVDGDEAIALAAAAVDIVKADADLMEKAGKRNSAKDQAAIQASHDHMVGLGAKCDKSNVEKSAEAGDLAKMTAERDRYAEVVEKALPTVDALTKRVDEQAAEIEKLKAQPMPSKTAGSSLISVGKAADASDSASATDVTLSVDQVQKALAALPEAERVDVLMRAALNQPVHIRL